MPAEAGYQPLLEETGFALFRKQKQSIGSDRPRAAPLRSTTNSAVRLAAKRHGVVLIAGTNGGMAQFGCDSMKQITRAVSKELQPGRDVLSIIESGTVCSRSDSG